MKFPGKRSRKTADLLRQLEYTGDGVFAVDNHHRIILWNQAAASLLGYTAQEALGKNCGEMIQGRDSGGVLICREPCPHFEAARSLRRLPNESFCARRKDGTDLWINITTVSVLSQRGRLSTLVHFFRKTDDNTGYLIGEKERGGLVAKSVIGSAFQSESGQPKDGRNPPSVPLSDREQAVLCLLAKGLSTKAVGEQLYISPITVKNHVQNILRKMEVHSRVEAVALAFHWRLV